MTPALVKNTLPLTKNCTCNHFAKKSTSHFFFTNSEFLPIFKLMIDKNDSGYSTNTSLQLKESHTRDLQLSPFQGYTCMFLVASLFSRNCHAIENIMKSVVSSLRCDWRGFISGPGNASCIDHPRFDWAYIVASWKYAPLKYVCSKKNAWFLQIQSQIVNSSYQTWTDVYFLHQHTSTYHGLIITVCRV